MKTRILWVFPALVLTTACSELPTAPERSATLPSASLKLQEPTRNTGSLGPALGAGSATNHEDIAGWFTLVVWDFADGTNQIDLARLSLEVAMGQTVTLAVGLAEDPCKTYQVDIYWRMPRAASYTISDTMNYPPIVSRMVYPKSHCRNPPSPPKECPDCTPTPTCINCGPVPPVCSASAFSAWEGHVDDMTIVEHMTVRPGYDGIVAYLVSWGVPGFRIGGDVPLPQPRVHLTTQILHVGANVMTAPLASASAYAGWQWEWGCEEPPFVLTEANLYDFHFLDGGWGNFEVSQ
jgi:hypothetical protein